MNFSERLTGLGNPRRTRHHTQLVRSARLPTRAGRDDFLKLCFTPKLAAEVTLQPMRCFSEGCLGDSLKLGNKPNEAVFFIIAGLEPVPSQPGSFFSRSATFTDKRLAATDAGLPAALCGRACVCVRRKPTTLRRTRRSPPCR